MVSFDLFIQSRCCIGLDLEPSSYISQYTVTVVCRGDDDKPGRVGKARAYRINADRADDAGEQLFDVCDSHSQELHECYALLYEPFGSEFRDAITDEFDAIESNVLLLDYLVLDPKWRGLKLGLLVTRRIVDELGVGCGLAVSQICTLSDEAPKILGFPPAWLPKSQSGSVTNLRRHFRQMGFRRIGRTDYYGLSLVHAAPSARELLAPAVR